MAHVRAAPTVCSLIGCVNPLPPYAGNGRPRLYCSQAHRQRALEYRQTLPSFYDPAQGGPGLGVGAEEFTPLDVNASDPARVTEVQGGGDIIRNDRRAGTIHKPLRPDQGTGESDPSRFDGGGAPESNFGSSADRDNAGLPRAGLLDLIDAVDGWNLANPRGRAEVVIYRNESAAPYTLSRGHEYSRKAGD